MSDNKKIFTNTLFLYFRMILIIAITLYTVRLVYNVLGIEDFGLFNLVASFILLFSFLNSAMRSGTQRFINVALASKSELMIKKTFYVALKMHFFIAIFMIIFLETLGLFWVNNFLNIPEGKKEIANIVYHCAIVSVFFNVLSVPYQAMIIAKEKMNIFAYITIIDAVTKLLAIIFALYVSINYEVLVLYSVFLVFSSLIVFILYFFLSGAKFKKGKSEERGGEGDESKIKKEIIKFSGWNLFGQISVLSSNQGVMLVYNIFFGVLINASLAISQQITSLLNNFVSNLQIAFNPQVVQSYAKQDYERHVNLVLNSSKYSLYLLVVISIPFLLYSELILKLWLGGELPQYVSYFSFIVVLVAFFDALSGPFWMSVHAQGNIKKYQLIISTIFLFNLPATYLTLKLTESIFISFLVYLLISISAFIYRIYYFINMVSVKAEFLKGYLKDIVWVFLFILIVCVFKYLEIGEMKNTSYIYVIFNLLIFEVVYLVYLVIFCFSKSEMKFFKDFLSKKFRF